MKETDGSLLDNKAQGKLAGGRYLNLPTATNHNNLLVSVANLMDVPITTFGNPAYCTGPIAQI